MEASKETRVLVVEDEPRLADVLRQGLEEEGYSVSVAGDVPDAVQAFGKEGADLVILDLMLPSGSGLDLAAAIRTNGSAVPILILTALDSTADVIRGLDAGADDYVTKPFAFQELVARVRALLRRGGVAEDVLRYGDLELYRSERRVLQAGSEVRLTETQFRLLEALVRRKGSVARREDLLKEVWGLDFDPGTRLVDVHITNLRARLESGGERRLVETVRGLGFRVMEAAEAP